MDLATGAGLEPLLVEEGGVVEGRFAAAVLAESCCAIDFSLTAVAVVEKNFFSISSFVFPSF